MFDALARLASGHARRVVIVAAIFFVVAAAFGSTAFKVLKPFGFDDPSSQSVIARESLARETGVQPNAGLVALVRPGAAIGSADARRQIDSVASTLAAEPTIGRVATPYQQGGKAQVSSDGRSAYVAAFFRDGVHDEEQQTVAQDLVQRFKGNPTVTLGGQAVSYQQVGNKVESGLQTSEMLAFPILLLLSLVFFRSLVAALLPLLVGGLSIVGALLGLRLGAEATDLSIFAVNLVTGLGLGLAIDYSLFIVSRYREELARLGPGPEALRQTMRTAGRTVVFSSVTVAAALAALITFPQRFLYSMGLGGAMVTLFSALVAVTVLPAILALLGERVNALAPKRLARASEREADPEFRGAWYRLSRFVMRRPLPIAVLATTLLITIGIPFLRINFVAADAGILPPSSSARAVDDSLRSQFDASRTTPLYIQATVPQGPSGRAEVGSFAQRLSRLSGVAAVLPARQVARGTYRIDAISKYPVLYSDANRTLVHEARSLKAAFPFRVGGGAAEFVDQQASLAKHLPLAISIIVATTLLVLWLMTGSLVLPIKALIMNLLTISATFGFLVFLFQHGRLSGPLGYTSQGGIDSSMPILLFAVAFGLSTDYGVFLLTRIKEARDAGASESECVAIGLERTGRIVSAAALMFCVAIGALATNEIIFIKEFGLGSAFAVLVDASIVRALLVPSLMEMLGKWNWWAPRPLRRLHERIGIAERSPAAGRA